VKDSKLQRDPASLTIEVPPGIRLLSLKLDVKNSPMTLAEVEGDFVAQVRVAGSMNPGTERTRFKGKDVLPGTFQGAGLILWQDPKNYARLERTVRTARGRAVVASEALLEIIQNGKMVVFSYPPVPDQPLFLRIQRLAGTLDFMFSPDGRRWASHRKLAVVFPAKLQVGLVASNMSKQPLSAQFEQFLLTTNKARDGDKNDP
jgi:regulation of enolase protein 1 (concanavalin A-like superfamily)